MDSVEFEDDGHEKEFEVRNRDVIQAAKTPRPVRYLIAHGIFTSETQATVAILLAVLLFLGGSGWIMYSSLTHPANLYVTDEFGREIPFDEYVRRIQDGEDPLGSPPPQRRI